ncbi:unnamed protein product [Phyllotreta striolata]|uniref:Uncharacterized protein n=1 Tax=Phyllotreta striolata TaxID=444603 RepID=A0A9N9TME5_PHYSR|nr:unnamed protein product [Phyllotreta striolata]
MNLIKKSVFEANMSLDRYKMELSLLIVCLIICCHCQETEKREEEKEIFETAERSFRPLFLYRRRQVQRTGNAANNNNNNNNANRNG